MAIVVVVKDGFNVHNINVTENPSTVGRSTACTVRVEDGLVSGKHCKFFLEDGKAKVEDLGTTNGTFLNGQKITSTFMFLKDVVTIGEVEITLDKSKMSIKEVFVHRKEGTKADGDTIQNISVQELKSPAAPAGQTSTKSSSPVEKKPTHPAQSETKPEEAKNNPNVMGKLKNLFGKK